MLVSRMTKAKVRIAEKQGDLNKVRGQLKSLRSPGDSPDRLRNMTERTFPF